MENTKSKNWLYLGPKPLCLNTDNMKQCCPIHSLHFFCQQYFECRREGEEINTTQNLAVIFSCNIAMQGKCSLLLGDFGALERGMGDKEHYMPQYINHQVVVLLSWCSSLRLTDLL